MNIIDTSGINDRIFNMSGVYGEELFSPPGATALDFNALDGTNCYCTAESASQIIKSISDGSGLESFEQRRINWIDTGDYHYLTALLMESVREPFKLLLYDNHPDRQALAFEEPGMLSCGSWVQWSLDHNPYLRGVRWVNGDGQAETTQSCLPFPASGADEADEMAPDGADGGKSLPVYISIDLDILDTGEFVTDWDQGSMSFNTLKAFLLKDAGHRRIHGIDVCGGLTTAKGAGSSDLMKNKALRLALREYILEFFNTTSL